MNIAARFMTWVTTSLNRQLLLSIGAGLFLASLFFMLLFLGVYRSQLAQERSAASSAVNRLLQASLENAMLKQDLDGLREIIRQLGQQADIHQVFISNPQREIRFASNPDLLHTRIEWPEAHPPLEPSTHFVADAQGREILRSVNPVHNKPACAVCHGDPAAHPVNGVLFVDYDAAPLREKARANSLLFLGAGVLVVGLASLGLWWSMRVLVLEPVRQLAEASQSLARGALDSRVPVGARHELGVLAQAFNEMADSLQRRMQEVREQERFLQCLIDAVPDGIRVVAPDCRVLKVNRAYARQLGVPQAELLRMACYQGSYARATPCPPSLVNCPLHAIQEHGPPLKTMTEYTRQDGAKLEVEVFAAPMEVEIDGQPVRLIVESVRDLRQAVQFSHEQKLAEMGQLASGVAHEIYNPLTSVRLAVQSTLRSLESAEYNPARLRDYLKLVDQEIEKCIDVTQRLLKLAAPGGGSRQLVDIQPAIRETVSLLGFESEARGIRVELALAEDSQRVLAQDNDVRILVLNLAQNAFHAMPQGGTVRIRSWAADGQVHISFADTGVGIRAGDLGRIFDPFYSQRADGEKGTGLGLSICKNLAEAYGGGIQVSSEWGRGACFTVSLPDARKLLEASAEG